MCVPLVGPVIALILPTTTSPVGTSAKLIDKGTDNIVETIIMKAELKILFDPIGTPFH
jgi:hypothetical protein